MSSLRAYWSLLGGYFIPIRGRLAILTLIIVINLVFDLATPWIVKLFIDLAMSGGDYMIFVQRPIALTMLILGAVLLVLGVKPMLGRGARGWRASVGLDEPR